MAKKIKISQYIFLASLVILLDRLTKYWAVTQCMQRWELNDYCAFELAFNRGISWGFFHSTQSTIQFIIVSGVIAFITAIVAHMAYYRFQQHFFIFGETLVIAGSLSNLFDRLWYHGVVDFIELSYGFYCWPSFNIADMCIVGGVGIMLMEYYRS